MALQRIRNALGWAFNRLTIWTSLSVADVATSPTITSGSGAPSASEANGSKYFRTNGTSYTRTGGAWVLDPVPGDIPTGADSAVTGISVTTDAAGTGASGSGQAALSGSTASEVTGLSVDIPADLLLEDFTNPAASGSNLFAQQTADFDTGAITTQPTRRNVQVVFDASWDGGDIEITGVDMTGASVTETVTANPGNTIQGVKAYIAVTRVRNLGSYSAGAVDVQVGAHLGVPVGGRTPTFVGIFDVAAGPIGGASLSSVGLVNLSGSPPNGTRDYLVAYTLDSTPVVTDGGHTHGVGTLADSGHTHTGPSHTHTVNVTDGGHSHTLS